ncbi:hypothetical protein HWV62_13815 [Athelia sp. TMB]|nr:hypothetical protein HWV62_13815 [Athelia sp. TMB]
MSTTTTALLSPRQRAKQAGHTYFFHTTDFARGRELTEPIPEEPEHNDEIMSDNERDPPSADEGEDGSESESEYDTERPPANGNGNGNGNGHGTEEFEAYPPAPPPASSWADLDLSVALALAAPVGQWLTGGDHVKNLFLVALLVFYLHQLIQVPWELYRASRPRRPAHPLPKDASPRARLARLAATELRTHEHAYLALTVLSPLLGAAFLRYTLSAITGANGEGMGWFSTTLFVLATGTRPWGALLARLRERTAELHDAVHYPSAESAFSAIKKLEGALKRIEALEQELRKTQGLGVEAAYDDLSGGLDAVEAALRKGQRKAEATKAAQDRRLAALERSVAVLLQERNDRAYSRPHAPPSFATALLALPQSAWAHVAPYLPLAPAQPALSEKAAGKRRLETIPEDPFSPLSRSPPHSPSPSPSPYPSVSPARKARFSLTPAPESFLGLVLAALTWPLRVVIALCRAFLGPAGRRGRARRGRA